MIKILCAKLFEPTFTNTLEILLSSVLSKKLLWNLVGRGSYLLGKGCKV